MKVGALLVGKEQVGFPETFEHLWIDGERIRLEVLRKLQPWVVPTLPQEDVDSVILLDTTKHTYQQGECLYDDGTIAHKFDRLKRKDKRRN